MTNIILSGCCGKMGNAVVRLTADRNDCTIVAGVDIYNNNQCDFPVYKDISMVTEKADVIIDFSNPALLTQLLDFAERKGLSVVICTTGYSAEQVEEIKRASEKIAVFYSGNMTLGINLLIELSKRAASVFGSNYDIEIVEKHHNQKLDAPSGTALMIADGISTVMEQEPQYVYDRHSYRKKREKNEIGIHAVRGGTIVGEHEVVFAGHDEVLTITHQAYSKEVFAVGAINAAVYLKNKTNGMYAMGDLLSEK